MGGGGGGGATAHRAPYPTGHMQQALMQHRTPQVTCRLCRRAVLRCQSTRQSREDSEEFPLNTKGADTTDYRFRAAVQPCSASVVGAYGLSSRKDFKKRVTVSSYPATPS